MKKILLPIIVVLGVWFSGQVVAEAMEASPALKEMATIMNDLNHRPSAQGKEKLKDIINASSTNEREKILADAMLNLEHKPMSSDIPKLESVIQSGDATKSEKALAKIIKGLNHRPSDEDKEVLSQIME